MKQSSLLPKYIKRIARGVGQLKAKPALKAALIFKSLCPPHTQKRPKLFTVFSVSLLETGEDLPFILLVIQDTIQSLEPGNPKCITSSTKALSISAHL